MERFDRDRVCCTDNPHNGHVIEIKHAVTLAYWSMEMNSLITLHWSCDSPHTGHVIDIKHAVPFSILVKGDEQNNHTTLVT